MTSTSIFILLVPHRQHERLPWKEVGSRMSLPEVTRVQLSPPKDISSQQQSARIIIHWWCYHKACRRLPW